ncbi:uncharacterized protein LOC113307916 [Papaver somniferum]|uniref:uncharacterized protein LOC113307916 n=1 Tax=Papaver somniferum TaxID=3469 RepID=UPI000E703D08|nr:uncharacterized protein LOC113307916 [Papaver somniferum]
MREKGKTVFPKQKQHTDSDRFVKVKKKEKSLDAICEQVYNQHRVSKDENNAEEVGSDSGLLRRSTRARRAPMVLDASPSPPVRKRRGFDNGSGGGSVSFRNKDWIEDGLKKTSSSRSSENLDESSGWTSRLRSRAGNVNFALMGKSCSPRGKRKLIYDEDESGEGSEVNGSEMNNKKEEFKEATSTVVKENMVVNDETNGLKAHKADNQPTPSSDKVEQNNDMNVEDQNDTEVTPVSFRQETEEGEGQRAGSLKFDVKQSGSKYVETMAEFDEQLKKVGSEKEEGNQVNAVEMEEIQAEQLDICGSCEDKDTSLGDLGGEPVVDENNTKMDENSTKMDENNTKMDENNIKMDELKQFRTGTPYKTRIREGRRCGLCGGGTDGKPARKLVHYSAESDDEAYGGSSASEEINISYNVLDGFVDEPGWLGRLLGPINDRFGIAGVWVHQNCAVWSPEVYFAGLGCLKNVKAALCRGRSLKCSRCGRPGATIGCRVDRCPKTYHLPCARVEGCVFDHRKFLIACEDHRHFFQPHHLKWMKKLKIQKMKLEMMKISHDASRKDLEVEEKWLENCGEDEEFLKREGKRLHRDLLRIAPVYIGGSNSENEKIHQGWESVAGLQDVIQCMKEVVILPLLYPELFSTLGITPPRGVLLHGYPGTGKTLVVRALIGSCARGDKRIAYFARKGADCLGKYVGDAERQLRLLFQVAEKSQPSIIFFDEIDGLAPCRTRQQDQTHNSVVSTLLALLDGLKSRGSVIVIGATNRPEAVDPALRRPGRFDREIYFPLPSVKDRADILSFHTQTWPKPVNGALLKWISQQTVGFAGADLQALCTQAAMIALKRNCAWQDLMVLVAEKKANNDKCPPLPSFSVEERDWLDALACAPPPCSRREAGMAASDVVSSPLQTHLTPCLLQPLSHLLVSLFLDERIWLPPSLYKAAELIKNVIITALEKRHTCSKSWWCHLHDLVQEADIVEEIEKNLFRSGLLIGPSSVADSDVVDDDDANKENEKFELHKVNLAGARANLLSNVSYSSGRGSGFRVLVVGCPRSGQSHLASCLLHSFVGRVEIQKVNQATISQEGQGDVVQGVTRILLKCARAGLCIIYLPRIDLWAMEANNLVAESESDTSDNAYKSTDTTVAYDARRTASQAWNTFIEQVDSTCLSTSLIILATSEVPNQVLPFRISQFFTSHVSHCSKLAPSEHTVPRFLVQLDENFDCSMAINSSAKELSWRLVQHYVQLIHDRTHIANISKEHTVTAAVVDNPITEKYHKENGVVEEGSYAVTSGRRVYIGNQSQQHTSCDEPSPVVLRSTDHHEIEDTPGYSQDSVPKILPSRTLKGKPSLLCAISTFGYQILRYPHFSELCWTTSKLKEGPCTNINGPWKGWPFNACIIRPKISMESVAVSWDSSDTKNRENSGVVRGLIAVGMLAYQGAYTSVIEVSSNVRKVLELLVEQINAKISSGKDRNRFLRLLSQVAYLEDLVYSWAYTLQSLELDSRIPLSSTDAVLGGSSEFLTGSKPCILGISEKNSDEVKMHGQSPPRFVIKNDKCIDSITEFTNLGLLNSEVRTTVAMEQSEQSVFSDHSSPVLPQSSSLVANSLTVEITSTTCRKTNEFIGGLSEKHVSVAVHREGFESSNGVGQEEITFPSEDSVCNESGGNMNSRTESVSYHSNGLAMGETDISNRRVDIHDDPDKDVNSNSNKNSDVSAVSGVTCFYNCCSDCVYKINGLIQKLLIHEKEKKGNSWTVEDVHDAVSSLSVNLLSSVRKFCAAASAIGSEFLEDEVGPEGRENSCACPGVGHFNKTSGNRRSTGKGVVLSMECSCHIESKTITAKTDKCLNSQLELGLRFFFRNNVLIPLDSDKDVLFHCKVENLCLSSLIELVLKIKQPLD